MQEGLKGDLAAFLQVTRSPYQAVRYQHKYSLQQWGRRMSWPLVGLVCLCSVCNSLGKHSWLKRGKQKGKHGNVRQIWFNWILDIWKLIHVVTDYSFSFKRAAFVHLGVYSLDFTKVFHGAKNILTSGPTSNSLTFPKNNSTKRGIFFK